MVLIECVARLQSRPLLFLSCEELQIRSCSLEWDTAALLNLEMQASCLAGGEVSAHWGAYFSGQTLKEVFSQALTTGQVRVGSSTLMGRDKLIACS